MKSNMTDIMQLECRSLLLKLRLQQRNLKHLIPSDTNSLSDSAVSDTISDCTDSLSSPGFNSSYARNKLKSFVRSSPESDKHKSSFDDSGTKNSYKPKVYLHNTNTSKPRQYQRIISDEKQPDSLNIKGNFLRDINDYLDDSKDATASTFNSEKTLTDLTDLDNISQTSTTPPRWSSEKFSSLPSTPNTAQKRSLIDRNIPVTSRYEHFEFNTNPSKLNFSYSNADDDDGDEGTFLKSRLNGSPEDIFLKNDKDYRLERQENERKENRRNVKISKKLKMEEECYKNQLKDVGNDKNYSTVVREATKPRSILLSPGTRNSSKSKSSSHVSFMSSSSFNNTRQELPVSSRLMGYDWIAALLDNETGGMDESESYFRELKEFRRSNRDECCNNFYMNSPLTFAESKEESPVAKALTEPKVKPYIVNNRLFTEPLKKKLLDDLDDETDREDTKPSQQSPRYVRVSIPRSTLEKPYKIKAHRRNSFDPTDSCSLREHCLMGWDNSRISALPTASSVDINEATDGLKPKMTTTLAEAEYIARTGTTQMWPFLPSKAPVDQLPTWRKHYQSSVMNLSHPSSLPDSSIIPGDSDSLRKSTNSLLNSTYSLMYEMERLKKERESTKA